MTKFSFSIDVDAKVKMSFGGHGTNYLDGHQHQLMVAIYNDESWEAYLAAKKTGTLCSDRMKLASRRVPLRRYSDTTESGKFELSVDENFALAERSHYFFFVLSDCTLEFYDAHPPALDYELHLLNGDSELPAFEKGLLSVHALATVALLAALIFAVKGLHAQYRRYGQIHASAAAASFALALQLCSCACETVHLATFARDGKGFRWRHGRLPLDFASDISATLSESVVVVLLVAVGCGWTLLDGSARRLAPIWGTAAVVVPFQLFLEVVSRRYEDDFSTFHDHDHWPGKLNMVLRIGAACVLLNGCRSALHRAGGYGTDMTAAGLFIFRFAVLGTIWLLSFPLEVFVIAPSVSVTMQHASVTSASLFCQSTALTALVSLFLGLGKVGKDFVQTGSIGSMGDLCDGPPPATASIGTAVGSVIRRKVAVD